MLQTIHIHIVHAQQILCDSATMVIDERPSGLSNGAPWSEVAEAGMGKLEEMRAGFARACRDVHCQAKEIMRNCNGFAESLMSNLQEHHNLQQQQWRRHHPIGGLASLTAAAIQRRHNPVADIGLYNPPEIMARLAGIPVYTVVNRKNEFVLASGFEEETVKQLGLFFLVEADAQALLDKIKDQSPKLAKQSRVFSTSMDKVYELLPKVENQVGKNLVFRLMPDANQVAKAIQLYKNSGTKVTAFTGVPVFQAEGLTVKTEKNRYTPLFFSKDDLDTALANARAMEEAQQEQALLVKAARANEDLEAAKEAVAKAPKGKERKAAQAELNKAKERVKRYSERQAQGKAETSPKVEVGCLEEVISKFEEDVTGGWANVMFIPAGSVAPKNFSATSGPAK